MVILLVTFFIGIVIALTKPPTYETSSTLLVESESGNQIGNLLQNYGGMLGISGSQNQQSTINSDLYPDIINSLPFQLELIEQELTFSEYDTTATLYGFVTGIYEPRLYHFLKEYTVGLNTLEKQFGKVETPTLDNSWKESSSISLPSTQLSVAKGIADQLELTVDNNKVTVNAWMPDPQASSELVNVIRDLLSKHVVEYRTEKAMKDMEFIEQQYQRVKVQFQKAQDSLAEFRDQNVNLATARAQTREERLQSEYDLAFQMYNNLAQQLEEARIKVQKDTPIFSTLHPVEVPNSPSSPDRFLIVFASIFLGGFLGGLVMGGLVVFEYMYQESK